MVKKSTLLILACVLLAGCDAGPRPYELGVYDPNVSESDGEYNLDMTVALTPGSSTDIRIEGVKVIVIENGSVVYTRMLGTFTTENGTRQFNTTVGERPDKILIKYDSMMNANRNQGEIFGLREFGEGKYTGYSDYDPEY